MSYAQKIIKDILRPLTLDEHVDAEIIEELMRVQYGTLCHLTRADFVRETLEGIRAINEYGEDELRRVLMLA